MALEEMSNVRRFWLRVTRWMKRRQRVVLLADRQLSTNTVGPEDEVVLRMIESREKAIATSGVRDVFTPAKPIDEKSVFVGRSQEVLQIVGQLHTPGQHALLWGDRGVGKTSLAKHLVEVFKETMGFERVFFVTSSTDSTFTSILEGPLRVCGCDIQVTGTTSSVEKRVAAEVNLRAVRGSTELSAQQTESRRGPAMGMTSADVCRRLKDSSALLVVDEAERISDSDTKTNLAELLKQLSDADAKFKVLIVGIAQAGADLVAHHESLVRCLKETHLCAMSHHESEEIVRSGMRKIGLTFDEDVISTIATIGGGYAHYVHLLALKCSEVVIAAGGRHVDRFVLQQAMKLAAGEAEESTTTTYNDATRSSANEKSKVILRAAATIDKIEFTFGELKDRVRSMSHKEMDQTYLYALVSLDGHTILRRMQKGVYRFSDPRMPGYIKIANGMVPEDAPKVPLDRSSSQ